MTTTQQQRLPDRDEESDMTMQAIVQDAYGGADQLRLARRDRPEPSAGEVLVKVHAAAVDRGTWHLMYGLPYLARLVSGLRSPRNPVPGLDLAGTVEAVGAEVTRFHPGDEVFGTGKGSLAEYAVAEEKKLAVKPVGLTFEQAAAVPVSGLTALQALTDSGRVEAGQQVLIIGASGGVGTYAVQIAKALGASVVGVASGAKADLVRSLGADHVINYQTDDFTEAPTRYDLIIDIGGNTTLRKLRRVLTDKGTLVIVGGEGGGRVLGGLDRQLRAILWSPFVGQRLTSLLSSENHTDLERLTEFIDAGQVTPAVERSYPLAEAPDALRHMELGHARGKLAIKIA